MLIPSPPMSGPTICNLWSSTASRIAMVDRALSQVVAAVASVAFPAIGSPLPPVAPALGTVAGVTVVAVTAVAVAAAAWGVSAGETGTDAGTPGVLVAGAPIDVKASRLELEQPAIRPTVSTATTWRLRIGGTVPAHCHL